MGAAESAVLLVLAGVAAGVVGAGGGVSSLVSYPALLAVGVPPLAANVVNLLAGVAIGPGSAVSSRRELAGSRGTLARLLLPTAAGALSGATLLVVTPPGVFEAVVPFLVLSGAVAVLLQPLLVRRVRRGAVPRWVPPAVVGVVAVYGGYFGAGSGVMLLAAVLVLVEEAVLRANALKNLLLGVISVVAAVVLVVGEPVRWSAVLPLAAGLLVGSALGPVVVRHLPHGLVRGVAAGCGVALAVYLWVVPG
ncbi:sulfite exporter TauE/SafE family protein [Microlunatus capsulatus]|uniref:Probable membrane transporter protein n=1 Tax=Microlunatus capsulatus TaxID=99117 RepID=A0ABS4Z2W5_9ACTN|nr:sulfite exporter TauE/SafE family protein [Microlunatus capsulatus]MBP2415391.1 putative membrane protein YfcA [Microlunatus capsulatus]